MRLEKLTHANLKAPVVVDMDLLVAWYFSKSHEATHLLFSGSAMLPVSESVETVTKLKMQSLPNVGEGGKKE